MAISSWPTSGGGPSASKNELALNDRVAPVTAAARISTSRASAAPLAPPIGCSAPLSAALASVVGWPSASVAHPAGTGSPVWAAVRMRPRATWLSARSMTIGAAAAPRRDGLGRVGERQRQQPGLGQALDVSADHAKVVRAHETCRGDSGLARQRRQRGDGKIDGWKHEAVAGVDHHGAEARARGGGHRKAVDFAGLGLRRVARHAAEAVPLLAVDLRLGQRTRHRARVVGRRARGDQGALDQTLELGNRQCQRAHGWRGSASAGTGLATGAGLVPSEMRSDTANSTLEITNTTWITTYQNSSRSLGGVTTSWAARIDMNCLSKWMAEIATIEDNNLSLRAVKSIVPIHSGQSRCEE